MGIADQLTAPVPSRYPQQDEPYAGNPWERQPWETSKAFLGFTCYRSLPPAERNLDAATRLYREKTGTVGTSVGQWSAKYRWKERVAAFEDHQDSEMLVVQKRERIKAAARHAREAAEVAVTLMHPIRKYRERIEAVLAGERKDQLDTLSDEDLLRLGRHTAAILSDMHKAERDAYGAHDDAPKAKVNMLRGEILREIMSDPEQVTTMEKVSFRIAEIEQESASASG